MVVIDVRGLPEVDPEKLLGLQQALKSLVSELLRIDLANVHVFAPVDVMSQSGRNLVVAICIIPDLGLEKAELICQSVVENIRNFSYMTIPACTRISAYVNAKEQYHTECVVRT